MNRVENLLSQGENVKKTRGIKFIGGVLNNLSTRRVKDAKNALEAE